MKKQLTLAAILGTAMLWGAADTYDSLCKEGYALHKARNVEGAAKFEAAFKLAKDDSQRFTCCNSRSALLMDCKKYNEAAEAAKEALKYAAAPDKDGVSYQQSVAYWRIGLSYNYANKGVESLEAYSKAAQLAPRDSWLFSNSSCSAGVRAKMLKKYEDAEKYFRECYECGKVAPDSRIDCRFQHAIMLIELKKPQDALKLMEKAEEISPKISDDYKAKIWDARARAYNELKKYDDALNAFLEMFKYTAKNDSYRAFCCCNIASLYRGKKDLANAAKYAQSALDCKKVTWGRNVRLCNEIIAEYQKSQK